MDLGLICAEAEKRGSPNNQRFFVTFLSPCASYTKTVARNLAAIVTEWLAVQ